jgi:DHA2 family multidrug resistance protein
MLLLALFTQKLLGYDAWTSGLVLAPGGIGNMISLITAGRLIARVDQRLLLALGAALNVVALSWMGHLSLDMDYWDLALPRFVQGFGMGLVFVPLQTLALSTVRLARLSNATAAYNVVRNVGGSMGIAIITALLARRSQYHQEIIVSNVDLTRDATAARLAEWTAHFAAQGSDAVTAGRQAMAALYREAVTQAQLLAFADDFRVLVWIFLAVLALLPLMRRVRLEDTERARAEVPGRVPGLPSAEE